MKQWEYQSLKLTPQGSGNGHWNTVLLDERLNRLGAEGWELVTSFERSGGLAPAPEIVMTFKRERPAPAA